MQYDIIIVGGGIVGLATACALAQNTSLSIALIEAKKPAKTWTQAIYQNRVSAITLASKRLLTHLRVWDEIAKQRVSPFNEIAVWDAMNEGHLQFRSNEIGESVLGYIVENALLQEVLFDRLNQLSNIDYIAPVELFRLQGEEPFAVLEAENQRYQTKLLIGADGVNSWVRTQANIKVEKKDYGQCALVATVATTQPHHQIARQCFLLKGPLAFLPLAQPNLCSIVWSLPTDEAEILLNLTEAQFLQELQTAFNYLGPITSAENRAIFPLFKQHAKHYIAPHLALVGDAAHAVHPLAGQGVNMGLLDAASLVDVISHAVKNKRDFASYANLRRYERWRKSDNLALTIGIDVLKDVFAAQNKFIQNAVSMGMNTTNQFGFLKNFFTRYACGDRANLPSLARRYQ